MAVAVMAAGFSGCNTNAPESEQTDSGNKSKQTIYLTVDTDELHFKGFHMQGKYVKVESNTNWDIQIENSDMFQSVYPRYGGSGNEDMYISVPEINAQKQKTFSTQYGSINISYRGDNGLTTTKKIKCIRSKY